MKVTLLLTFLAVANAAYFDEAVTGFDDFAPFSPMLTRAMFRRFGFVKPAFDANFISFGRSLGASDQSIGHMHALYDQPAVLFFMDPMDGIVSYYADAGLNRAMLSPELRSVFPSVLRAADSMAIVYHPESFLGSHRSFLPGQFFVPSQSAMLAKVMRDDIDAFPLPVDHAIFRKKEIADIFPELSPVFARFDIDEFPFAYKSPVALRLFNIDSSVGFPSSRMFAKSAFPGYGGPPFNPFFKSAYPLHEGFSPAYFKSSYPFFRSEMPAYHSGFIPTLKFPLLKHFASFEPLVYAKPSFKILPYHYPISQVTPIASTPIIEPASPVENEERGYPFYLRGFPSFYPSFPSYPALRYPTPFDPSPIVPAASSVAGASASSMASAASMAGAGVDSAPYFLSH